MRSGGLAVALVLIRACAGWTYEAVTVTNGGTLKNLGDTAIIGERLATLNNSEEEGNQWIAIKALVERYL